MTTTNWEIQNNQKKIQRFLLPLPFQASNCVRNLQKLFSYMNDNWNSWLLRNLFNSASAVWFEFVEKEHFLYSKSLHIFPFLPVSFICFSFSNNIQYQYQYQYQSATIAKASFHSLNLSFNILFIFSF